jgi:hypothetical protein
MLRSLRRRLCEVGSASLPCIFSVDHCRLAANGLPSRFEVLELESDANPCIRDSAGMNRTFPKSNDRSS